MINKILISTGGSGGHVIPAIILFEHLSKKMNYIFLQIKEVQDLLIKIIIKLRLSIHQD